MPIIEDWLNMLQDNNSFINLNEHRVMVWSLKLCMLVENKICACCIGDCMIVIESIKRH